MQDDRKKTTAQICVVSHHGAAAADDKMYRCDVIEACEDVMRLDRMGYRVMWVTSEETVNAGANEVAFTLLSQKNLPPTCRYVLPCQLYRLAGATVFAVEREVWRDTALQTRLFSFFCLLFRELSWDVVHARGDLTAVFVAIYSARFLGVPAVVSYDDALIASRAEQPFIWHWINRHVALASVRCEADRQRLLKVGDLVATRIRVVGAGELAAAVLYAELMAAQARNLRHKPDTPVV